MQQFKYIEENIDCLEDYKKVSIGFNVESEYDIELINNGIGGINFNEVKVNPYWLDHDTEDSNPSVWPKRWDLSNWYILSVYDGVKRVAGAIVAYDTDGINMLEGRKDLAVLWDLRVDKEYRRHGVGSELIKQCLLWSKNKGCNRLKIETQNTNVKACLFYEHIGARLSNINKYVYGNESKEVQIIWSVDIKD